MILDPAFAASFVDLMAKRSIPFAKGSMGSHVLSDMISKINLVVKPDKAPTLTATPHSPLLLKTVSSNGNGLTEAKSLAQEASSELVRDMTITSGPSDASPEDAFRQV